MDIVDLSDQCHSCHQGDGLEAQDGRAPGRTARKSPAAAAAHPLRVPPAGLNASTGGRAALEGPAREMGSDGTSMGYFWAASSAVLFGSFAVPIKTPAMVAARVDPAVIQAYKSMSCFLSSWLVLLFRPFQFSYWGIVGAAIWVSVCIRLVQVLCE